VFLIVVPVSGNYIYKLTFGLWTYFTCVTKFTEIKKLVLLFTLLRVTELRAESIVLVKLRAKHL
jgi:hypothetical protein